MIADCQKVPLAYKMQQMVPPNMPTEFLNQTVKLTGFVVITLSPCNIQIHNITLLCKSAACQCGGYVPQLLNHLVRGHHIYFLVNLVWGYHSFLEA